MESVCVFCGSSPGVRPSYVAAARRTGETIARRGLRLVYGGGKLGLIGAVADAAQAAGGTVVGLIPQPLLRKEVAHAGLTELRVVGSMHERKALMAELADGFLTLPGGFGTYEEFCEVLTWAQLGIHAKPCALLDVDGFYAPLVGLFDAAVGEGFVHPDHRAMVLQGQDPERLLDAMGQYVAPTVAKWVTLKET